MKTSDTNRISHPTLIGGAARSGKTALALALQNSAGPIAGFPLEGVFHVYNRRRFPFFKTQRKRILSEYLNRPRYTTSDRVHTESPIDYMGDQVAKISADIPSSITHQISLLGWVMDHFCESQQCRSWAVFDLHPEFFFETYKKFIPNLRLAIMHRDPYEAIAAAMFWRSWPEAPPNRRKRFRLMLASWYMSNVVSDSLIQKYPNSVSRFSFNMLCAGDKQELSRLTQFFPVGAAEIEKFFSFAPHFRFDRHSRFLTPKNDWEKLLTSDELSEIGALAKGIVSDPSIRFLLTFSARAPNLTRQILDAYLYPGKTARRHWNALKQLMIDAQAGVQLRFNR